MFCYQIRWIHMDVISAHIFLCEYALADPRGTLGTHTSPLPRPISFFFMQFLTKSSQIRGWKPLCLGNPGSATGMAIYLHMCVKNQWTWWEFKKAKPRLIEIHTRQKYPCFFKTINSTENRDWSFHPSSCFSSSESIETISMGPYGVIK